MDDDEDRSFGPRHFGGASLGDIRRTQRLVGLADAFCRRPDASLPGKCGSPAAYQGLQGLLDGPDTTHATVLDAHFRLTQRTLEQRCGLTTLLVGDITELDYTSKTTLRNQLGPIGNGGGHGFECFNLLAVDPDRRAVLGLANPILFRRRRRKMTRAQIHKLPATKRQSGLWMRATKDRPPAPPKARVVRVFDREGDSDEALNAPGDFLIRSRTDRCIRTGPEPDAPTGKLHTFLRSLPTQGRREVAIEPSKGHVGRTAACGVSYACVPIRWARSPEKLTSRVWCVRCGSWTHRRVKSRSSGCC